MSVTVLLFARLSELIGGNRVRVDVADRSVATVRAALARQHPAAAGLIARSAAAVNGEYAGDEREVGPEDEIALIPPVSGG